MKRFIYILATVFAFSCFGATNSTRIKDLPLATSTTTNTSFVVDDATYGVRRVNLPKLVNILTNDYGIGTGGGTGDVTQEELTAGLAPKLDASGGTATNTTFTGTSAFTGPITSAGTITLSSQRIIGVANPVGSADAANKLWVENKFTDTVLSGTTVASAIQADRLQSSQIANASRIAIFDADGVITNNGVNATAITGLLATDSYAPTAFGAVADGTTDDTAAMNSCAVACVAANVPMNLKGLKYAVSSFKAPAGLRLLGYGATLKANTFPSGVGTTNMGVIHINGDNVVIDSVNIDGNRTGLAASRVPVDSNGNPSGATTSYVFTRLLYGIIAENLSNITIQNCNFTNGFNEAIFLHACTNPKVRNIKCTDQGTGPKIVNCVAAYVDGIEVLDSMFTMDRMDQFGLHLAFNYNCIFVNLRVRNIGGTSAGNSTFLSGINCWGNVNCTLRNLIADGVHPSNTLASQDGILLDGISGCLVDTFLVSGGWRTPGVETMATINSTIQNGIIDMTGVSGSSWGFTVKNEGNMKGPGPGYTNYRIVLQRGRSQGADTVIRNVRTINARTGFWINSPYVTLENCVALGGAYAGFEIDDDDGNSGAAGTFNQRIPIQLSDIKLINCVARGYELWGVRIYGGARVKIVGGDFLDNSQSQIDTSGSGIYGASRYTIVPGSTGANNITVGAGSSTLTINNKLDYRRVDVFNTSNVFVQSRQIVANNGVTQITVSTNFSPSIASTDRLYIGPWDQGGVEVQAASCGDTQNWIEYNTVSFNPQTCTTLATLTNLTFTRGTQRLFPYQLLRLVGVATGGADNDVIVRVKGWTEPYADQVEVTPISLGNGNSLATATLVVPTVSVAGVWSTSATGSWMGSRLAGNLGVLTPGSGASTSDIEGFFYLINSGSWTGTQEARRVYQFNSATDIKLTANFTSSLSGGSIAKVAISEVRGIPSQLYGARFDNWNGTTKVIGMSGFNNLTADTLTTTAPNTTVTSW